MCDLPEICSVLVSFPLSLCKGNKFNNGLSSVKVSSNSEMGHGEVVCEFLQSSLRIDVNYFFRLKRIENMLNGKQHTFTNV